MQTLPTSAQSRKPYDPEYSTYTDQCAGRNGGYQATWAVPAPKPPCRSLAYFASFDGMSGKAVRDVSAAVWFIADDGAVTILCDADAPYLQLHGRVDITQEQRLLDDLHGGLLQLVDHRQSEHAAA